MVVDAGAEEPAAMVRSTSELSGQGRDQPLAIW